VGDGSTIRVLNVWEVLYLLGVVAAGGFVEAYVYGASFWIMFALLWCKKIVL
jgi:hypothetical protein